MNPGIQRGVAKFFFFFYNYFFDKDMNMFYNRQFKLDKTIMNSNPKSLIKVK